MSKYYRHEDIIGMIEEGFSIDTDEDKAYVIHKLLPSLPTIEVSEDCISREYVRAKFDYISYAEKDPITIAKRIVDDAPSVTTEQSSMVGEWLEIGHTSNSYMCSVCGRMLVNIAKGKKTVAKSYPYCHCGAKMK